MTEMSPEQPMRRAVPGNGIDEYGNYVRSGIQWEEIEAHETHDKPGILSKKLGNVAVGDDWGPSRRAGARNIDLSGEITD